jgi:dinuclear metal center YbgI/SA1388 family protein
MTAATATASLDAVLGHLDELLEPETFDDFGPNGLQIPGRDEISLVVTGVSAHVALLERAIELGADLLLVHHGLIWDFQARRLSRRAARRLRLALEADLNVAMYHLPLDAHPRLGNNALLAEALGAAGHEPFGRVRGRHVGRMARFSEPLDIDALTERVRRVTEREPLVFPTGPAKIERVAILSGAGANQISQAIAAGADAYVTGEPAEHVPAEAREGEIHFLVAGHHATERFGVRALGDELALGFGIRHEFVDVPNPI